MASLDCGGIMLKKKILEFVISSFSFYQVFYFINFKLFINRAVFQNITKVRKVISAIPYDGKGKINIEDNNIEQPISTENNPLLT